MDLSITDSLAPFQLYGTGLVEMGDYEEIGCSILRGRGDGRGERGRHSIDILMCSSVVAAYGLFSPWYAGDLITFLTPIVGN